MNVGPFFVKTHGLPPPCNHNHKIQLQGVKPTCVRLYQYLYYQKREIEHLVTEILHNGIVRTSSSPYSSPVLRVRKANGIWRICVDYRALNKDTMKDKNIISNIDKLLDELYVPTIFSKLWHRYHQIRMNSKDI